MLEVIDTLQLYLVALVFARVSALLVMAPLFRGRNVPNPVKIGLALLIALLLQTTVTVPAALPPTIWELCGLLLREILIGLSMGFLVQLFFLAVGVAGQLIDTEMGFHMANVLDPLSDSQLPLIGNLFSMLSILLYLSLNGHLLLFRALAESYQLVPLASFEFTFSVAVIINSCARLLTLAVQIALPLIGASLFTSLMFGIMAKAVPQMNVFIVGMPLKVVLLSIVLVVALPSLIFFLERGMGDVFLNLADWLASGMHP